MGREIGARTLVANRAVSRAAACPATPGTTSTQSLPNSTAAHARRSAGKPQPSACLNCSPPHVGDHVLQRPLEFADRRALRERLPD